MTFMNARIFLVRHGQSLGNADKSVYEHIPDWKIPLTECGYIQANDVGKKLFEIINENSISVSDVAFYYSPYVRAFETYKTIRTYFVNDKINILGEYEDIRLREHEWGRYRNIDDSIIIQDDKQRYGEFYYQYPNGESCCEVFDRTDSFICNRLIPNINKQQSKRLQNIIIVGHGISIHIFQMVWYKWTITQFASIPHIKNCEFITIENSYET
jgi:broad specificity phosphatase PhoE